MPSYTTWGDTTRQFNALVHHGHSNRAVIDGSLTNPQAIFTVTPKIACWTAFGRG